MHLLKEKNSWLQRFAISGIKLAFSTPEIYTGEWNFLKCSMAFSLAQTFRTVIVTLLCCIVLNNVSFAQDLVQLQLKLQEAELTCGTCLDDEVSSDNIYLLEQHHDDLEKILNELDDVKDDNFAKDFISIQVDIRMNKIIQQLIDFQDAQWNDLKSFRRLRTHLKKHLYKWKKLYSNEAHTWGKIKEMKNKNKAVLAKLAGIENGKALDYAAFNEHIWTKIATPINERIDGAEVFMFDKMIGKNPTLKQLEEYMIFSVNNNGIENKYSYHAFVLYYQMLTIDGEFSTIKGFEDKIKKSNVSSRIKLLNKLKESDLYLNDRNLSNQANKILNTDDYDEAAIKKLIPQIANKETGLLALQKLIAGLINKNNFDDAVNLVESYRNYFESENVPATLQEKYNNLITELKKKARLATQWKATPVKALNTDADEIRFVYSKFGKYIGVVPFSSRALTRIFEKTDVRSWKLHKSEKVNKGDTYLFTIHDIKHGEDYLERIPRSEFFQTKHQYFNGHLNRDCYASQKYEVAFFASNADFARADLYDEAGTQYNSPFNNEASVTLQTSSGSSPFHGKVNGNGNLDIYYSLSTDGGKSWNTPQHLGPEINTGFCERSPVLSEDGHTLYFASEGHGGLGGFDIFKVPIIIEAGKVKPGGMVVPVTEANSPFDELYYQILAEGKESEEIYFSSNRNGSFDIFALEKSENSYKYEEGNKRSEAEPEEKIEDIPFKEKIEILPAWPGKKMNLTMECIKHPPIKEVTEDGFIILRGRVFDHNGHLIKEARMTFYTIHNHTKSHQIREGDEGKYEVMLKANATYKITITGTTQDGMQVKEFLHDFIDLCPNDGNEKYAFKDHQTQAVPNLQAVNADTGFDFFFDTNKHEITISDMLVLIEHYRPHIEFLASDKTVRFLLEGFADVRGKTVENYTLASNRLTTTYNAFLLWGYDPAQLDTIARGETIEFDKQDLNKLSDLLPPKVYQYTEQEKKWQLNRRVRIRFTR